MTSVGQKQTIRQREQISRRTTRHIVLRVSIVMSLFVLSTLYLTKTNDVSTKGYDIATLQREIAGLEHETQRLEVEIARGKSLSSIEARLPTLELVVAHDVTYLSPKATVVARR